MRRPTKAEARDAAARAAILTSEQLDELEAYSGESGDVDLQIAVATARGDDLDQWQKLYLHRRKQGRDSGRIFDDEATGREAMPMDEALRLCQAKLEEWAEDPNDERT